MWEYTEYAKSWSETRVYWQFIFPGSLVIFSGLSCHNVLKILPFRACNPKYSQPEMDTRKTFDAKTVNINVLCTSPWYHVPRKNILINFELQRNTVQVQSKHPLHYFLKSRFLRRDAVLKIILLSLWSVSLKKKKELWPHISFKSSHWSCSKEKVVLKINFHVK